MCVEKCVDGVLRYYAQGPVEEGNFEGVDMMVSRCGVVVDVNACVHVCSRSKH